MDPEYKFEREYRLNSQRGFGAACTAQAAAKASTSSAEFNKQNFLASWKAPSNTTLRKDPTLKGIPMSEKLALRRFMDACALGYQGTSSDLMEPIGAVDLDPEPEQQSDDDLLDLVPNVRGQEIEHGTREREISKPVFRARFVSKSYRECTRPKDLRVSREHEFETFKQQKKDYTRAKREEQKAETLRRRREFVRDYDSAIDPETVKYIDSVTRGDFLKPSAEKLKAKKIEQKEEREDARKFREMCARNRDRRAVRKQARQAARSKIVAESDFEPIQVEAGDISPLDIASYIMNIVNPLGKHPETMDAYGPWVNFVYLCCRARNPFDVWSALYTLRPVLPELINPKEYFDKLMSMDIYDTGVCLKDAWDYFTSSIKTEAWSDSLSELKGTFMVLISGEIGGLLQTILLSIVSFKTFGKEVSAELIAWIGKPPKMTGLELCAKAFDAVVVLLRTGEQLSAGLPFHQVLLARNPTQQAIKRGNELLALRELLYTGLPVEGRMCAKQFVTEGQAIVELLSASLKKTNPLNALFPDMTRVHNSLQIAVVGTREMLQAQDRITPYGIVLYGAPHIGKSKLLNFVADIWSRMMRREFNASHVYHRTKVSTYWENYQPLSQPIIHYSEIGNTAAKLVASRGDPIVEELTTLVDSLPYPVDMAFDGKGKTFAQPELVLVDTNCPDMNAKELVRNPAAIARRFLFIEPRVKPEFRKEGTSALDSHKSLNSDLPPMDRWTFTVRSFTPLDNVNTRPTVHMDGSESMDIYRLTSTLEDLFYTHMSIQTKLRGAAEDFTRSAEYSQMGRVLAVEAEEIKLASEEEYGGPILEERYDMVPIWWSPAFHWLWQNFLRFMPKDGFAWRYVYFLHTAEIATTFVKVTLLLLLYFLFWFFDNGYISRFLVKKAIWYKFSCTAARFWWLIGRDKGMDPLSSHYFRQYGTLVLSISGAMMAYYYAYCRSNNISESEPQPRSESSLYCQSSTDELLAEEEEKLECGSNLKRIPVHNSQFWNVREIVDVPNLHKGTAAELYKTIRSNIRSTVVVGEVAQRRTRIFGLKSDLAIINTHAYMGLDMFTIRVSTTSRTDVLNTVWRDCRISRSDIRDLGDDISIVRIRGLLFKDITKHLAPGPLQSARYDACFEEQNVLATVIDQPMSLTDKEATINVSKLISYRFPEHRVGLCGAPLIIEGNGAGVAAIHAGGAGLMGYAVVLNPSLIAVAISELEQNSRLFVPVSQTPIMVSERGVILTESSLELQDPHIKSPFRYDVLHGIRYYGSIPGDYAPNDKSSLRRTPFTADIDNWLFEGLGYIRHKVFSPPMMRPQHRNGEYISPYNIALRKMATQKKTLDPNILAKVVDRIVERAESMFPKNLKPLSLSQAINGVKDDYLSRRVNVRTGAGFGFWKKKEKFLPQDDEIEAEVIRTPTPDLKAKIAKILATYAKGGSANCVYKACLKDEAREREKALNGKTRLFFISPLDHLLVSKMMLSPFYTALTENMDLFCTAVGINAYTGADDLAKRLLSFSDLIMEGDYGNYDTDTPFDVGLAAATIIERLMSGCYNGYAMSVVKGILTDMLFPFVELNGDLFEVPGQQPSGRYATAEDNCLRGLIMLMYAWYSIEETRDLDFFEYVLPVTYGDDVLAAVKATVAKYFNNLVYRDFCEKHYGMKFTPATKSGEMQPFLTIDTCSFLKRRFVFRNDLNRWVMPIDLESIAKSLQWFIPSKAQSRPDQLESTACSAMWELALHTNEETHDRMRSRLEQVYEETFGTKFTFPSYNYIIGRMFPDVPLSVNMAVHAEETSHPERILVESSFESFEDEFISGVRHSPEPQLDNISEAISSLQLDDNAQICCANFYEDPHPEVPLEHQMDIYRNQLALIEEQIVKSGISTRRRDTLRLERETRYLTSLDLWNEHNARNKLLSRRADILATLRVIDDILADRPIFTESAEEPLLHQENLKDIPGEEPMFREAGDAAMTDEGQYSVLNMGDFLARPVRIYEQNLPLSTDFGLRIPVWDTYSKHPSVRAKMRNFAYFKGDLQLRIVVSGSPFHYGRALVSYQPYAPYNQNITSHLTAMADPTWRPLFLNYLSQAPGSATINYNQNMPLEISCPFISPKPMFRLFNNTSTVLSAATSFSDFVSAGDLFIYSLNQVKSASATPTQVYIQIYAWVDNAELGTSTATQIEITTESSYDEIEQGPVERIASRATEISAALSTVPAIAWYAKASTMFFSALAGLSAHFGWSKPVKMQDAQIFKQEPLQNGALTIGTDTNKRIVLDPKQELSVDPRAAGSSSDDMAIACMASRPSYYNTVTWTTSSPIMATPIHVAKVTPSLGSAVTIAGVNFVQPTALAYAAAPFTFWRGSITFRFEIACSKFHRGKMAVIYEPNLSQQALIVSDFEYNKQFIQIVDIQSCDTFEVTVQWAGYRAWYQVTNASGVGVNQGVLSTVGVGFANGFIALTPFTQLQSPDGSDVSINMYVYSKDIRLNYMSDVNMPSRRLLPTVGLAKITAESSYEGLDTAHEIESFVLNPSSATTDQISEVHFGEQPVSFRALLKRYVFNSLLTFTLSASTVARKLQIQDNVMPVNNMVYNGAAVTEADLYSYLKYAFLAVRGGVRKRFHSNVPLGEGPIAQVKIRKYRPSSVPLTPGYTLIANNIARATMDGAVTFVPRTSGGIEVEFPFYTNNLWFFSFSDSFTNGVSDDEMNGVWGQSFVLDIEMTGDLLLSQFATEFAAAEDFSLMRFQGAPFYSY